MDRLFYDCAGWSGRTHAAERGAEWVRIGLTELPASQIVFATDYPQAVHNDNEVVAYVNAVRALGSEAQAVLHGATRRADSRFKRPAEPCGHAPGLAGGKMSTQQIAGRG